MQLDSFSQAFRIVWHFFKASLSNAPCSGMTCWKAMTSCPWLKPSSRKACGPFGLKLFPRQVYSLISFFMAMPSPVSWSLMQTPWIWPSLRVPKTMIWTLPVIASMPWLWDFIVLWAKALLIRCFCKLGQFLRNWLLWGIVFTLKEWASRKIHSYWLACFNKQKRLMRPPELFPCQSWCSKLPKLDVSDACQDIGKHQQK